MINENKTYKKLYEEEVKGRTEGNENFKDFDNISFEGDKSDIEEVPVDNKNT